MAANVDLEATPATSSGVAPRERRGWLWSFIIGLVVLGAIGVIPLTGDPSALHDWTLIVMYCVLAQGWNFIGGFAGYAAFGNVAFFGIGAYAAGLVLLANQPYWLGLLAGVLVAALFAFLLGLPVLRLRGHYFAIATLGIAEALREFVEVRDLGGGGGGLVAVNPPSLDSLPLFFYAFLATAVLTLIGTTILTRSRFGYALVAIRENEQAAEALGIATYRYKVAAFVLSAVPTAFAGGLYAYWSTGFDPSTVFDVRISVEMVLLTFLGGAGTILGPLLGGILFEYTSNQFLASGLSIQYTLLGLLIIVVTLFLPQGLIRLVQEIVQPTSLSITTTSRLGRLMEGVRRVRRFIAANGV